MPLSDAQKKRRAYWDSLLPKEKPKAFSWNKQEKKEAPQPDATPGITLLQAAFRGSFPCRFAELCVSRACPRRRNIASHLMHWLTIIDVVAQIHVCLSFKVALSD